MVMSMISVVISICIIGFVIGKYCTTFSAGNVLGLVEAERAKIAETAMWMMDHIMNNELSLAFGETYARIPLDKAATVVCGDALEVDWETVLPAQDCD